MKYTGLQSQQMAFTQSPSMSNNPKILNNYLIFAASDDDSVDNDNHLDRQLKVEIHRSTVSTDDLHPKSINEQQSHPRSLTI